jgi:hypothetical protein
MFFLVTLVSFGCMHLRLISFHFYFIIHHRWIGPAIVNPKPEMVVSHRIWMGSLFQMVRGIIRTSYRG